MGVYYDPKTQEIYVADTKNDLVGIFNSSGISLFAFGGNDDIKEPIKVISDDQGSLLVLDINRRIKIYNYRGEFLKDFDHPELQGKKTVGTMTFDHESNLYIGENENGQILVFDRNLNLKLKFGSKGEGKGKFKSISSIAIDKRDGRICVTDYQNAPAVQVFDKSGNFLLGWGEHQMGPHNFSLPGGIAIDSKGRIFIADTLRQDIKVFTEDGKMIYRFGGLGYRAGQVAYPVDIAIDPSDKIYVVEKVGRRVQVFQEVEIPVKPRS
jgi:DNA-binding beta-propeller fold protein YncE